MIKKVIKFLDKHRLILIIIILIFISIMFLSVKSILFLNHNFNNMNCTKNIDETYCYHNEVKVFKNAEEAQITFFKENKEIY